MPVPNESSVGTYLDQAELDAGDLTMIENVFQGYAVISGGAVTAQGSPNGTVAVAAGVAKAGHVAVTITAGNVSVISGSANPDGTTATAADAALARYSLITINASGQLGVLHGTPAGLGPNNDGSYLSTFPTFAGKTVLASIWVPPLATTVTTAYIWDKREIHTDGDFIARVITPTVLSANVNDYGPVGFSTANVVRQGTNSSTQRNVSGLDPTGHKDGKVIYWVNPGPGPVAFLDESTSSSAANRFALPADVIIPVDRAVEIFYDVASARWRAVGTQTPATANTITLGTAAVAGTSNYYLRPDDTIAAFDATVPVTQAYSDAAATGSAAFAARRDHKHGMPAGSAGVLASLTAPTSAIADTEVVILSATIAANTLAAGDTFVLRASGVGTTSTAPGTGNWRLRFNPATLTGSSVSVLGGAFTASRTTRSWTVEFTMNIRTIGATGTVMGEGFAAATKTGAADLFTDAGTITTSALTVDTTVANLIELTFQSAVSTASIIAHTGVIRRA